MSYYILTLFEYFHKLFIKIEITDLCFDQPLVYQNSNHRFVQRF